MTPNFAAANEDKQQFGQKLEDSGDTEEDSDKSWCIVHQCFEILQV